jgi:hypothetical protein
MIIERFIQMARKNAKRPLPTRRSVLCNLALWSVSGLISALTIGLLIGKTVWHAPFDVWDPKNWAPFLLLIASVLWAFTQLRIILDGVYRGGSADTEERGSVGSDLERPLVRGDQVPGAKAHVDF